MALGGTLASTSAWIGMALFIAWLVMTKRLPVQSQLEETLPDKKTEMKRE
jgi:hypothetical protein